MTIRTTILVDRPPLFSGGVFFQGGSLSRGETWRVTVTQVKEDWGLSFEVLGTLLGTHLPDRWDSINHKHLTACTKLIHGVHVPAEGPECFGTLGQARNRARAMAALLEGTVSPIFTEQSN